MADSQTEAPTPSLPQLERLKTSQASVPAPEQSSSSPPTSNLSSPARSPSSRRSRSPLSLDLSSVPSLIQPTPPSNTLLITNLESLHIFHPASLATIRQHIQSISSIHTFSPLKSLRRIICSFYDTEAAIAVRNELDGAQLMGERTRVYFGEPLPIDQTTKYLDKPDAGKLFFISPPPSPPVGWEIKNEDPPNKEVHANDLAQALEKLNGKMNSVQEQTGEPVAEPSAFTESPIEPSPTEIRTNNAAVSKDERSSRRGRTRSGSTVIYDPEAYGDSPALPAVILEDMTLGEGEDIGDRKPEGGGKINQHTSRPPLELLEEKA
ncbi:MAG: hypothetical protein Q9227_002599 [Pyrenula ochraceoflavens]